jgi:hypothetical protein
MAYPWMYQPELFGFLVALVKPLPSIFSRYTGAITGGPGAGFDTRKQADEIRKKSGALLDFQVSMNV